MTNWVTSNTWDLGIPERHRLEAAMNAIQGKDILDIACRDGTLALTLAQAHPEMSVKGFDTDASSIAWANNKAEELNLKNASFYELDLLDEKTASLLGEHAFDTVLIMETLEHLPVEKVDRAYANAERFVKKGGRIIVTVPANSHISDPDHKQQFYREYIIGPDKTWLKGCPHLWIGWYTDITRSAEPHPPDGGASDDK